MINSLRTLASTRSFRAILMILALSFVLWGVGDLIRSGTNNDIVTFKYAPSITRNEFTAMKKEQINKMQSLSKTVLNEEAIRDLNINNLILNQLINQRMLQELAKDYDIDFSNDLVAEQLKKAEIFQNNKGEFDKSIYHYYLKSMGLKEQELINNLKFDIAQQLIFNGFMSGYIVPEILVTNITDYLNETRTADIVKLNIQALSLPNNKSPNAIEIEEYYNSHKQSYTTMETRDVSYILVDKNFVASTVSVSSQDLETYYQENIDDYKKPEMFSFYNVTFTDYDSAAKILEKIKQTNNFEKIIQENFNRPANEFLLQNITKDKLEGSLLQTLKTIKNGASQGVIKTKEGYNIIKKVAYYPAVNKSLEQVKGDITAIVKENKISQQFDQLSKYIEDEISSGASLTEIAKKFHLNTVNINDINVKNLDSKLGKVKNYGHIIFKLQNNEISELLQLDNGGFVVFELTNLKPSQVKQLNEVKNKVIEDWIEEKKYSFAYNVLNQLIESNNINGLSSLIQNKNLAKGLKLIKDFSISRAELADNTMNRSLPQEVLINIFLSAASNFSEIITHDNNLYLILVKNINNKNKSTGKITSNNIRERVINNFNNALLEEILIHLRNKNAMKVNYNDAVFQE